MRRTHLLTAAVAVAGTLGITAALGFGQPDGIEPPTGPVADTQPSLTSISNLISSIDLNLSETNSVVSTPRFDSSAPYQLSVGSIRLERVYLHEGGIRFEDAAGHSFELQATQLAPTSTRVNTFDYRLHTDLVGPITFTSLQPVSQATLVFKELP